MVTFLTEKGHVVVSMRRVERERFRISVQREEQGPPKHSLPACSPCASVRTDLSKALSCRLLNPDYSSVFSSELVQYLLRRGERNSA